MALISFHKMHGLGNDFMIVDGRKQPALLSPGHIRALADRRRGVGCDQVIVLEPSRNAAARMRIYNCDGSEAGACGNATRCVAHLLLPTEAGREEELTLETAAGLLTARRKDNSITVDMGLLRYDWRDIPVREAVDTAALLLPGLPSLPPGVAVNIGNPHIVFFVDKLDDLNISALGPAVENHPLFPERINAGFAEVTGTDRLRLIVWERGAGLTEACGSGASAAAAAAFRRRLTGRTVTVDLPGGRLILTLLPDGHVEMTGPAAHVFEGTVNV